jgi:hypothetical protein
MPTTFSTALPAIATMTSPVNAFEIPSFATAGSMTATNQSDTNAAARPASARTTMPTPKPSGGACSAAIAGSCSDPARR